MIGAKPEKAWGWRKGLGSAVVSGAKTHLSTEPHKNRECCPLSVTLWFKSSMFSFEFLNLSIICHRVESVINLCEVGKKAFNFSVCSSLSLIFTPFVYDLSKLDLMLNDHASVFLWHHTLVFFTLVDELELRPTQVQVVQRRASKSLEDISLEAANI